MLKKRSVTTKRDRSLRRKVRKLEKRLGKATQLLEKQTMLLERIGCLHGFTSDSSDAEISDQAPVHVASLDRDPVVIGVEEAFDTLAIRIRDFCEDDIKIRLMTTPSNLYSLAVQIILNASIRKSGFLPVLPVCVEFVDGMVVRLIRRTRTMTDLVGHVRSVTHAVGAFFAATLMRNRLDIPRSWSSFVDFVLCHVLTESAVSTWRNMLDTQSRYGDATKRKKTEFIKVFTGWFATIYDVPPHKLKLFESAVSETVRLYRDSAKVIRYNKMDISKPEVCL